MRIIMKTSSQTTLFNMCMIIDKEKNKVLVQDKINSDWTGITFPGGKTEYGESIVNSTIREVKEETGLDISELKTSGMIHWYNTANHDRWIIYLFKTEVFQGELIDETVEGKVFWMPIDALETHKLAPNMDTYGKLFFNDNLHEAYATWSDNHESDFELY